MADSKEKAKELLRKYLNPSIKGKNVDAVLEALAVGPAHLIDNIEAIYDQLYIVTAQEKYLDQRMSDRGITRPDNIGLLDSVFRKLGIEISTRKQVRDLILNILETIYGFEFTKAQVDASRFEPYNLQDGDKLLIQIDDGDVQEIVFKASDFGNIANATAQEVADAITRELRKVNAGGFAVARDNGLGYFVQIYSNSNGPASSIAILGGRAQNELRFPEIRQTTGDTTTQWQIERKQGITMRATWVGGANPSIGKIRKDDYVNIFGPSFNIDNRGTFNITSVKGGTLGNAYVEFENPNGVNETVIQGTLDGILFFNPKRITTASRRDFATVYQVDKNVVEVFIPAITKVVRRDRKGAAHLHESGPSASSDEYSPYIYDITAPFIVGDTSTELTSSITQTSSKVINVVDSSQFPDSIGSLILGYGTSHQEGPIPYLARPSSSTILIDPSYTFKKQHQAGTDVALIDINSVYDIEKDGTDYPFYITDVVSGRVYAEELINLVAATGINLVITVLYPNPIGLEKWNSDNPVEQDKWKKVWGPDEV